MKTVKLGDICEFKPAKSAVKDKLGDDARVSFSPMEQLPVAQKYFTPEQIKKLSEVYSNYVYFEDNDVIYAKITPCFENGKLSIAKNLKNGVGFGSSEFMPIRCSDQILPEYLYYFLLKPSFIERGSQNMRGASGHKRVPDDFTKELRIILPDIQEQQRVVERLDAAFEKIDRAIELTEKNIENVHSLRLVATKNLLEHVDGQEKTVGDVIKLEYGKPLERVDRKYDGKFAAYGANGIKDMTDRYYWDIPSIIIGRKGSAGELTRVNEPFWPLDVTYYVTHDATETNLDYIFYALDSFNLPSLARGVKPGINRNDVYSLPFKLPVIEEQEATAKKIDTINEQTKNLTEQHRNKVAMLKALKQSLLAQAFSQSEVE